MADWQKRQARICSCGGADDMCPCQNVDRSIAQPASAVPFRPASIDTADKSGDWVLLWAEGLKPQPFFWDETRNLWVQSNEHDATRWTIGDGYGPTHWAPLPTSAHFKGEA